MRILRRRPWGQERWGLTLSEQRRDRQEEVQAASARLATMWRESAREEEALSPEEATRLAAALLGQETARPDAAETVALLGALGLVEERTLCFRERMEAIRARQGSGVLVRLLEQVAPQVRILGWRFALLSLLVVVVGVLATPHLVTVGVQPLSLAVSLGAALGVVWALRSLSYGVAELEMTAPVHPLILVWTRLLMVVLYDILLAAAATVLLMATGQTLPGQTVGQFVLSWLSPLLFLSGVTVCVASYLGVLWGSLVALTIWSLQLFWIGKGHLLTEWAEGGGYSLASGVGQAVPGGETTLLLLAAVGVLLIIWAGWRVRHAAGFASLVGEEGDLA